ncbi:MAG TPA: NAD(P)/FAD-dependent oxidoreductase [Enhygromyxa sp.]|nr:NAD(P)/FAD-dependent oxidoreductase [Enhygromyxa sp.]
MTNSSGDSRGVDVDVVIVGGRPAGSTLAARLGAAGHRVLLVDRARFPSPPGVPSSPLLYQSAMAVLDELGIDESEYRAASQPTSAFGFAFGDVFETVFQIPTMWGRNYVCGLDRVGFDEVLWRNLARFPSVERREGFAVTDLLRDEGGRVVGVIGSERGGPAQQIRARAVVGADGRFSLIARKVGAPITEQEAECVSTVYFAEWEGVTPFGDGLDCAQIHVTGRGLDVLCLPMPGGRMTLNTHARADRVDIHGDAQRYYVDTVRSVPTLARRLGDARQVTEVVGIKRVGNGYRRASGPGWVLVGDAAHYKDPVDGQGIYDALTGARLLAAALGPWLAGELGWEAAMAEYQRELYAATHPMYLETVGRLRRELYDEPPTLVIKTLIRWTMTDPAYQTRFMNYLGRTIPVAGWSSPQLIAGAVMRGIWRDLTGGRARAA